MSASTPKYTVIKTHHVAILPEFVDKLKSDAASDFKLLAWKDTEIHMIDEGAKNIVDDIENQLTSMYTQPWLRGDYLLFSTESFDINSLQDHVVSAMSWVDENGEAYSVGGLSNPINVWRWDRVCMFEYELYI